MHPNINRAIPCHGAKVRIRNGVLFFHTLTDMSGDFNFGRSVRNKVNYGIVWERDGYIIKNMVAYERFNPVRPLMYATRAAFLDGPKLNGEWRTTISDRQQSYYATIHRAACDYYYHTPFGLQTPPQGIVWGKMTIAAFLKDKNNNGYFTSAPLAGNLYHIGGRLIAAIFDADRMKIDVYATTIHELAHAVHFVLRGGNPHAFGFLTHCELRESWARAVEWAITSHKYRFFIGGNLPFSYRIGFQDYDRNLDLMRRGYTPLMIDLIDEINQFSDVYPDVKPFDEVQSFTIKECENAIRGNVRNFGAFYQNLINNPKAQSQLNAFNTLFEFYYSLSFHCSSGNNQPNTRQEGGVR